MPNIFGAGLLDILNQGGQFLQGRQAGQRERADKAKADALRSAQAEALMDLQRANATEARARATALLHPTPKEPTFQEQQAEAEGQIAPYASKPTPEGFDPVGATVSDTIAHAGFKNVDPQMLFKVTQARADKKAETEQERQDAQATKDAETYTDEFGDLRRRKTGEVVKKIGKPISASGNVTGFGSAGIMGAGRVVSGVPAMDRAHANMKEYEQAVLSGQATFGGIDQFASRVAGHFQANGLVDEATFATANAELGKHNPELANYLQNEYLWALEDSNLSSRPSDFRTRLDQFVSSMRANPNPKAMQSIWDGRESRLNGYKTYLLPAAQRMLQQAGGGGGDGAAPPAPESPPANETPGQRAARLSRERGGGR